MSEAIRPDPADWFADVLKWSRAVGATVGEDGVRPPDYATHRLRRILMREELNETILAMSHTNLPEIADGLADLIWVALGTAVAYGISMPEVFAEVSRANWSKVGAEKRADGKVGKGKNYRAPDIAGVLARQRPLALVEGER